MNDFKRKGMIEERGEILTKQENILAKAVSQNRNLTASEEIEIRTLEAEYKRLSALIGDSGHDMQKLNGGMAFLDGGSVSLSGERGIRLFGSKDKVFSLGEHANDINLANFLKAAIQKPGNDSERAAIQASLGSDGYTLPTHVAAELVDRLRAGNPLIQAGARTMLLEGSDVKMVRVVTDPSAEFLPELGEQDLSTPAFDSVSFAPKTVRAIVEVGRELLQDSENVGEALSTAFIGSLNNAILTASFTGSGPNQPAGLLSQISVEEAYNSGSDPDWSHFVKANRRLYTANVPFEGRAHVLSPDVWESLALQVDNQNRFQNSPQFIENIPAYTSSGCPEGVGYCGDFSQLVYGFRLNIMLEQHQGIGVRKYASTWLAVARLDMKVLRPAASLVRIREHVS